MKKNKNNGRDGFKQIEDQVSNNIRTYIFGDRDLIDAVALTVFAGHIWAKERDFTIHFDEGKYDEEKKRAIKELENIYRNKSLQEVIDIMIERQTSINKMRRFKEGYFGKDPGYECNKDKWEAKRHVAYLFFEEIKKNCVESGICPDLSINLFGEEIITLLKSLTVEEYCRIRGYLSYRERDANPHVNESKDNCYYDYMEGMKDLDSAFLNCKCKCEKKLHENSEEYLLSDEENIITAKYNPRDRLGILNKKQIGRFVRKYYSFIKKVLSEEGDEINAEQLLIDLYNKSNSKIINITEYLLKCMISSYVTNEVHDKIRHDSGKQQPLRIRQMILDDMQKDPLFY